MNDDKLTHITHTIHSAPGLTPEEKGGMREELMAFMALHPVRDGAVRVGGSQTSSVMRGTENHNALNHKSKPTMLIGIIIAAFIGGSTAFAAEGSLPGDLLYPVKIHVTEEVQDWIAVSAEAQARWEKEKAERRIEEAQTLEAKGELTVEAKAAIGQAVSANAQTFAEEIKTLRSEGKDEEAKVLRAEFVDGVHAKVGVFGIDLSLDNDTRAEIEGDAKGQTQTSTEGSGNASASSTGSSETKGNVQGGVDVKATGTIKVESPIKVDTKIDTKIQSQTNTDLDAGVLTGVGL